LTEESFHPIAERTLQLRGPAERTVVLRIGAPEKDPAHRGDFRCPFQVVGLSNDGVQYAHGVDSFQALNLAFAGLRREVATTAAVLGSFHDDFSLTWEGTSWEVVLPVWTWANTPAQARRLERFLEENISEPEPEVDT